VQRAMAPGQRAVPVRVSPYTRKPMLKRSQTTGATLEPRSPTSAQSACPSRTLPDVPASQDELGPHLDIAKAVASLIEEERGDRAIALVGAWGSGKSTVANLLSDELEKSQVIETLTFIFDAWAHEGDPLRLAFLRRFAAHLTDRWGGDDLSDRLDRLEKRTEETVSTATTEIDRISARVLLALAILPLGYLLIAEGLGRDEPFGWGGTWVGVGLVAPFILILVWALISVWRKRPTQVPALLARQLPETITVNTVRTPDPTTLEFQKAFGEMVEDALAKDRSRRLVIVADNLDRMDREAALQAWTTMRSFFEVSSGLERHSPWRDQLWLVVPFDPGGMSRIWAHGEGTKGNDQADDRSQHPTSDPLVDAFLNKTFQVTFHVPPPVLSDWRGFLTTCLDQALPGHASDDSLHAVYRVVHRHVATGEWSPTPRNLKMFVNRLSAIHRQWCRANVPLEYQAVYALEGNRIEVTPRGVLTVGEVDQVDEDAARYLAAIHFNVPPAKAFQVLLAPRVEQALLDTNAEAVGELAGTPGFFEVCEHLLEDPDFANATSVGSAATALVGVPDDASGYQARIWDQLAHYAGSLANLDGLNEQVAAGLTRIVERVTDRGRAADLARHLLDKSRQPPVALPGSEESDGRAELAAFGSGLARLLYDLQGTITRDGSPRHLELEGDDAVVVDVLAGVAISAHGPDVYDWLVPTDDGDVPAFAAAVGRGDFEESYATAFKLGVADKPQRSYESFVESVEQRLKQESLNADQARPLIDALVALMPNAAEASSLQRPAIRGALLHHFHDPHSRSEWDTAATFSVPVLLGGPGIENFEAILGQANNGANRLRQVIAAPEQYADFTAALMGEARSLGVLNNLLTTLMGDSTAQGLGGALLAQVIDADGSQHAVPAAMFFEHFEAIAALLNDEAVDALVEGLINRQAIADRLQDGLTTKDAKAFTQAVGVEGWSELCAPLRDALRDTSEEDWQQDLDAHRQLLALATKLADADCRVDLVAPFRSAVTGLIGRSLAGGSVPLPAASELAAIMTPQTWRALLRSIVDLLADPATGDASEVLNVFGRDLLEPGVLDGQRTSRLVEIYGTGVIGRANSIELDWLDELLLTDQGGNISAEASGAIRGSINAKLGDDSLPYESRTRLEVIRARMGKKRKRGQ
jgi:hypothetical protein